MEVRSKSYEKFDFYLGRQFSNDLNLVFIVSFGTIDNGFVQTNFANLNPLLFSSYFHIYIIRLS